MIVMNVLFFKKSLLRLVKKTICTVSVDFLSRSPSDSESLVFTYKEFDFWCF